MSTEIALRNPVSIFPSPAEWTMLKEQATIAVNSGLLPRTINTPEKAIVIALKGREVGIPPMQAFGHIHVVDGKPGFSAELMLALIYKNCSGAAVNYLASDEAKCELEAARPGHKASRFSFTIEDARNANLLGKGNWKSYPAAMLRARAISAMARAVFPDAIMGCSHTPEELGAEVDEDGIVISVPPAGSEPPKGNEPPKQESKPAAKPRTKAEIGAEILAVANELNMNKEDVAKFAHEEFKKDAKQLTVEEMEKLLATLQYELGSRKAV